MESSTSLLWTALPLELVLAEAAAPVSPCINLVQGGRILEVLPVGQGMGVIQRLISTDPQDYLDPAWQPGTRVPLA